VLIVSAAVMTTGLSIAEEETPPVTP